jgi:hypothetical protein
MAQILCWFWRKFLCLQGGINYIKIQLSKKFLFRNYSKFLTVHWVNIKIFEPKFYLFYSWVLRFNVNVDLSLQGLCGAPSYYTCPERTPLFYFTYFCLLFKFVLICVRVVNAPETVIMFIICQTVIDYYFLISMVCWSIFYLWGHSR